MSCSIRFTPLLGTGNEQPVCGLLEVDGARLLLNCGWSEQFEETLLEPVIRELPSIDAVVLTHPDLEHLGALPFLIGRHGLKAPIFGTGPIRRMGQLAMQELLLDKRACSDFNAFSLEDVTTAFDPARWATLRFYQKYTLELPGRDGRPGPAVTLTPYNAGHLLGGCVWRIVAGHADGRGSSSSSEEEVLYAVDWCHKKERHLASCMLSDLFYSRPALMITDAMDALSPSVDSTQRDVELLDVIMATLRGSDGSVLIPCDATGRVLEVALLLDAFWAREKLDRVYPLVMLSDVSKAVAEVAQSQLEFMSDSVGKAFEMRRDNPFNFHSIRLLSSCDQLAHLQAGPKVVLAPHPSLEHGPSKQIALQWAANPRNTICFVQRPPAGSLGDTLLRHPGPWPLTMPLKHSKRVPLEGVELEEWEKRQSAMDVNGEGQQRPQGKDQEQQAGAITEGAGSAKPAERALEADKESPGQTKEISEQTEGQDSSKAAQHKGGAGRGGVLESKGGPLRTNCGKISMLVKDAATGGLVQMLGDGVAEGSKGGQPMSAGTLMDGFVSPQGAAYPTFPDEDEDGPLREDWDDYGACVDHDMFKQALQRHHLLPGAAGIWNKAARQRQALAAKRAGIELPWKGRGRSKRGRFEVDRDAEDEDEEPPQGRWADGAGAEPGSDEEEEEQDERPTKIVTEHVTLAVHAAVRYFNYDGRADARIVRKVLGDIAPRALAITRGSEAARADLCAHIARGLAGLGSHVAAPGKGETLEATTPPAYMLYVSDAVNARTAPHKLGGSGYSVSLLDAVVGPPSFSHPNLLQLVPVPPPSQQPAEGPWEQEQAQAAREPWLGDVFLVDGADGVQLSAVKKALADAGIQSTWLGQSAISCGGVVISKLVQPDQQHSQGGSKVTDASSRGHMVVEAAVSEQCDDLLQRVRAVIYRQYSACT